MLRIFPIGTIMGVYQHIVNEYRSIHSVQVDNEKTLGFDRLTADT